VFERHQEIMERRKSGEANESGFTLIELLIVIVVLGILAAIVVFSLTGVSGQSKQAACTSDAKSVEVAVDAYEAANSGAIPTQTDLTSTTGTITYLHSWPSKTNGYDISIDSSSPSDVDVSPYAAGADVTPPGPTAFDDSAGCTANQVAS
jgi:prepilin-type N-terminal cleavage/methylation domain-containing protein